MSLFLRFRFVFSCCDPITSQRFLEKRENLFFSFLAFALRCQYRVSVEDVGLLSIPCPPSVASAVKANRLDFSLSRASAFSSQRCLWGIREVTLQSSYVKKALFIHCVFLVNSGDLLVSAAFCCDPVRSGAMRTCVSCRRTS